MTEIELQNAIYNWVNANVSGVNQILWRNQNVSRPDVPFIDMQINPISKESYDVIFKPKDGQDADVKGNRRFTLNIQHFGFGGYDRLNGLRNALETTAGREKLTNAGISFIDDDGILDLSELVDTRFEPRHSIDLFFYFMETYATDAGQIDTVKVGGEHNIEDDTIYQDIITITT